MSDAWSAQYIISTFAVPAAGFLGLWITIRADNYKRATDAEVRRKDEIRENEERRKLEADENEQRRKQEAKDAQERSNAILAEVREGRQSTDDRIKELEVKTREFMPRAEIEAKIEHEKANRVSSDQQLQRSIEANTRDIVEIKVGVGRLEQKQDSHGVDLGEIKTLIKEQNRDVNAKLDRLSESMKLRAA